MGTSEPGETCVGQSSRCDHRSVRCVCHSPVGGQTCLLNGGENPDVEAGRWQGGHETHYRGTIPAMESPTPRDTPFEMGDQVGSWRPLAVVGALWLGDRRRCARLPRATSSLGHFSVLAFFRLLWRAAS